MIMKIRQAMSNAWLVAAAAPLLLLIGPTAQAEQSAAAGELEEITVTARHVEENLQDIPIAITALTAETIAKQGIENMFDIQGLTPGLQFNNDGCRCDERPSMRGVTTQNADVNAAKAAIMVDGIYVTGNYEDLDLDQLQRIEVLKGPQSTQFGRSAFSGAINFVTRDPTDKFAGAVSGEVANQSEQQFHGMLSGPIFSDKLLGMVTYWYYNNEGPWAIPAELGGGHANSEKTNAVTGKLIFNATDNFQLKAYASFNEDHDGQLVACYMPQSAYNLSFPIPAAAGGGTDQYYQGQVPNLTCRPTLLNSSNLPQPGDWREQWRTYLKANYSFLGGYNLSATAAYNYLTDNSQSDQDLGPTILYSGIGTTQDSDKSIEIRLASPQTQRFRWMVGIYSLEYKAEYEPGSDFLIYGPYFPGGVLNLYYTGLDLRRNSAAFAGLYWDALDKLTLSFEGRYQSEHDFDITDQLNQRNVTFLPRANVEYKLDSNVRFYATYSKGDDPGTFNTSSLVPSNEKNVAEERLTNYEIGVKSTWLDNRLLFNAAVYHMVWSDMQEIAISTNAQGAVFQATKNAGDSRINGLELEVDLLPATGWDLRLTGDYNDAKYTSYCSVNYALLVYGPNAGSAGTGTPGCVSVAGNRIENEPEFSGSFSAGYKGYLTAQWNWFARGTLVYTGKQYTSEMNYNWFGPSEVLAARLGVATDKLRIEAYAKNLTNTTVPERVNGILGNPYITAPDDIGIAESPRRPRQIGLKVSYAF